MQKTHDYEHNFVNHGAVGKCRLRVYEEIGERPVVIATQEKAPQGAVRHSVLNASGVIAAHLIKAGVLSEFNISYEVHEKSVQSQTLKYIRSMAPFVFVEEYVGPPHQVYFLWFDSYQISGLVINGEVEEHLGNAYREDTTPQDVEELIGQPL